MKTRSIDHPSSVFAAGSPGPAVRTGLGQEAIAAAIADNLHYQQAVSSRVRDPPRLVHGARAGRSRPPARSLPARRSTPCWTRAAKVVAYLSAEFLTGPHLGNT